MKFLLGKKISMTQKFQEDGTVLAMTAVEAGPCTITQVKGAKDGYEAVQIGYGLKKRVSKPVKGHLKNLGNFRWLKEFRTAEKVEVGQQIDISTFQVGDKVTVTGWSKGKGFQGVVKRHGFHGSPATHGHKDQLRMPGSIGAGEPQRVFKGKRMAGRMGDEQVTVHNLKIVEIDPEKKILYISGAVPGARNGLVMVRAEGDLKIKVTTAEPVDTVEPIATEPVATAAEGTAETAVAVEPEQVNAEVEVKEEAPIESGDAANEEVKTE